MKLSSFDFTLPTELIAQYPAQQRDSSDLLIIPPDTDIYTKTKFSKLLDYLYPDDVIVFNNSRVLKAKLLLNKNNKLIQCYLNKPISTLR